MPMKVAFKPILFAAISAVALSSAAAPSAFASDVTWNDLQHAGDNPHDVLQYGIGTKAQRFSKLDQINTKTVSRLEPAWSFSFGDEKQRGQEGQALVHDGVIYITASYSRIFALDAKTGRKLWSYTARLPDDIRPCCDVVNRGAAIFGNKVFMGLLDASMVALDKDTGKGRRPRPATRRRRRGRATTRAISRSRGTTAAARPGSPRSSWPTRTPSSSAPATRRRGTVGRGRPATASSPRAKPMSMPRTAT